MGARSNYETITRVIQAFARQHTWKQAELAREVQVETRALRRLLLSLSESRMPLEKEEEHPHVYWSVPRHWFPGGVIFDAADWEVLVHAVLRIPDRPRRRKLLERLLAGRNTVGGARGIERLDGAVAAMPVTAHEQEAAVVVEKSILESVPLRMHYYSASRGQLSWRVVSPQRLITEPHGRLVAYCHNNRELRWFRIDNIQRAQLEQGVQRVELPAAEVTAFVEASPDGYHDGTAQEFSFHVRSPTSAWVRTNLLSGMQVVEDDATGIRVKARGGALVVARFITALGGEAVADDEDLRSLVQQLADLARKANESC